MKLYLPHTKSRRLCFLWRSCRGHTLVYVWEKYIEHILPYSIPRTHSSCSTKTGVIHVSVCRSRRTHTDVYYDIWGRILQNIYRIYSWPAMYQLEPFVPESLDTYRCTLSYQNIFYRTYIEYILDLPCTNLSHSCQSRRTHTDVHYDVSEHILQNIHRIHFLPAMYQLEPFVPESFCTHRCVW